MPLPKQPIEVITAKKNTGGHPAFFDYFFLETVYISLMKINLRGFGGRCWGKYFESLWYYHQN
ncbi:hypothetical protein [Pedobacter sp. N23S346]|uniref:hypothetical protein n=1 Tax=Pedobacter sp. N23S346 TaxID=3402750 RepID=UPI003ACD1954